VTDGEGDAYLTAAFIGISTYSSGALTEGGDTLAPGDYLEITFVADGTTKQIGIDVSGSY